MKNNFILFIIIAFSFSSCSETETSEEEINQNPWYQFTVIDRVGYFTQEGFLHSRMDSTADPRVAFYRSSDLWSIPSLGAATAHLPVLTAFELQFIKAEAQFRSGDLAGGERLDGAWHCSEHVLFGGSIGQCATLYR